MNIAQSRATKELKKGVNLFFVQFSISWSISHTYVPNAWLGM
jgi:hypothetical protein